MLEEEENEASEELRTDLPPLVTMGNPELARPSLPVPVEQVGGEAFLERVRLLEDCMVAYLGIGIAAPQVGWFERFFLMTVERPGEKGEPELELVAWVNPEVVWQSEEHNWAWEGCLSVPGLRGWIRRPAAVTVRGLDHLGEPISREYTGWDARVFQHEFDHLEGMLFPYRALDPRHVVIQEELEHREQWPDGWPAPGARDAPMGAVVPE